MSGLPRRSIKTVSSRATAADTLSIEVSGIAAESTPRHVIDDVQNRPGAAGRRRAGRGRNPPTSERWLGFDEGSAPATPRRASEARRGARAHREAFFAIKPVDAVDARGLARLPQQDEQPTISETLPLVGEIAQLRRSEAPCLAADMSAQADHLAVSADDRAGPPSPTGPSWPRRCATPSRLTAGPYHFIAPGKLAKRGGIQHLLGQKLLQRERSRPRAASAVWPRRHPCRRTWTSSCKALLLRRRAYARQIRRLRPALVLLQHPDDLIFREPCSLHLSVLQRPDSKSPWRKISVAGQGYSSAFCGSQNLSR